MNFVCSEVENMSISVDYYEFIKQIYETLTKYIKGYKSETNDYYKKISKLNEKYSPKLFGIKEDLKKFSKIKKNNIILLSSKVPKIIEQQITNLKYFVSGIETTIKSFDKTLKDKNSMSSKYQNEYEECRNNLLKKYKDIEKSKNSYFSNASQTEDLIYKYYLSKNQNEKKNNSTPEPNITDAQIENNIKITKKNENEYLNLVKSAKPLEEKFFELSDSSTDNMKRISCEIITKMKDNIVDFLLLLKNCFKLPLSEIDTYLPELIKLDENKKIELIINSTYKKDHNLIPIEIEKYYIKLIQQKINNNEDEESNIIDEAEILNTIKKMEDNFELIEKDSLQQINSQSKLRCRELTFKLLSFSNHIKEKEEINNTNNSNEKNNEENKNISNNNDDNNNIETENKNENNSITQEEVEELSKLIDDKSNRFVFLRNINTFRKYGQFEIPEREFNIICDLFNKIADKIKKENDYDSLKNIIILSKTYYKLENNKKIYIQEIIKKNQLFKEKEVWEDYVNSSILKEVQKHLNNDIKDPSLRDSQKLMEKDKYSKIIFAQILPLINNMITYELNDDIIKSISQTLISYYKIDEESSKIIYDTIENKGIKDEKGNNKYKPDLTRIEEENEEEEMKSGNDKINITKNINEKNDKNEGSEDINTIMIANVNETLEDEQDLNSQMIKNITSEELNDEINEQMIKDCDDEDNEENENNEEEVDNNQNGEKK